MLHKLDKIEIDKRNTYYTNKSKLIRLEILSIENDFL